MTKEQDSILFDLDTQKTEKELQEYVERLQVLTKKNKTRIYEIIDEREETLEAYIERLQGLMKAANGD